ncbi:DUF814 family protein [Schizosaccharomyces cryophilus OY26]|uniref:Ribosome quality control complex subunit 2 n=1 Tax=Schizosaccharomyces cryophilus (strain OY26 / ATCC MYA-4695 / CBS 11777 / NBRC 106824 / NRRL Y48691) TaxID=653667 RepID=S9XA52_SCHCR|nr:DUF814 family protein [Schizosaccharomyces cryophilus OY26]EPY50641.1 DUF814 family protein [Schizosaccharomyces cryophilus OY26]
MKQRFSALDITAIGAELREEIIGCRLNNIHDLNSRTFLLKFGKQDKKYSLVIESGFRVHLTKFQRENAQLSGFVTKLRKHIKSRRLTNVSQLDTDRVLVFTFGGGENDQDPSWTYYLVCEFFAAGNILLLDGSHKILSLLRVVTFDKNQVYAVGQHYNLDQSRLTHNMGNQQKMPQMTAEKLTQLLEEVAETSKAERLAASQKPNGKQPKPITLRKALTVRLGEYGNALVEHCIRQSNLDPLLPADQLSANEDKKKELLSAFQAADGILSSMVKPPVKGYIFSTQQSILADLSVPNKEERKDVLMYEDFHPFKPLQLMQANRVCSEFRSYNECVDEFFSSLETQKMEKRAHDRVMTAERRIHSAKDEQEKKIKNLQEVQHVSATKAQAIEMNSELVEAIASYISNLLNQGMDWLDIEKLIQVQKRRSPVAACVVLPLKLKNNAVNIMLPNPNTPLDAVDDDYALSDEDESEAESSNQAKQEASKIVVEIDLSLGAYANARRQYEKRREAIVKETKTLEASSRALKNTQRRIDQDLKRSTNAENQRILPTRKAFFFEKFHWFFSSEGYMVIGGRDAQQNELLFARYCNKGDVFVCADLPKSSIVIVKNRNANDPLPPNTLQQAGSLALASSKAWDSKTVISAWWVQIEQVSKTGYAGDVLPAGSFAIRGSKNYLPPSVLTMGYGILWLLDEQSTERRCKKRAELELEDTQQRISELKVDVGFEAEISQPKEEAFVPSVTESKDSFDETPPESSKLQNVFDHDVHIVSEKRGKRGSKPITAKKPSAKERREARKKRRETALEESSKKPVSIEDASDPQAILAILKQKKKKKSTETPSTPEAEKPEVQREESESNPEDADKNSENTSKEVKETTHDKDDQATLKPQRSEKKHKQAKLEREDMSQELYEEMLYARDALTPTPDATDTIVNAVPTFAPYSAMAKFNLKVKVTPGSAKVGKSARESIAYFTKALGKPSSNEVKILENLKDGEIVAPFSVNRLRVVFGSGLNSKKSKK